MFPHRRPLSPVRSLLVGLEPSPRDYRILRLPPPPALPEVTSGSPPSRRTERSLPVNRSCTDPKIWPRDGWQAASHPTALSFDAVVRRPRPRLRSPATSQCATQSPSLIRLPETLGYTRDELLELGCRKVARTAARRIAIGCSWRERVTAAPRCSTARTGHRPSSTIGSTKNPLAGLDLFVRSAFVADRLDSR